MAQVDKVGFVAGFVMGFVVAGVLGFILGRIRQLWGQAGAYNRPQTVRTNTTQTPAQVGRGSVSAALSCLGWAVLFVITLAVTVMVVRYYWLVR
jgi:hypothetical protein